MKRLIQLVIVISWPSLALAQTQFERDLQQLRDHKEKLLAAAAEPINRRYQTALEQLLRRAMQANDLDSALKIKAVISGESNSPSAATPSDSAPLQGSKVELEKLLAESRWQWFNAPVPADDKKAGWVEFYKGGIGKCSWGPTMKYTVTGPNTLKFSQDDNGTSYHFTVDIAGKEARFDPVAGAGHDHRSMNYKNRLPSDELGK